MLPPEGRVFEESSKLGALSPVVSLPGYKRQCGVRGPIAC